MRRQDEAVGDGEAAPRQLAEVCALAPHQRPRAAVDLSEGDRQVLRRLRLKLCSPCGLLHQSIFGFHASTRSRLPAGHTLT